MKPPTIALEDQGSPRFPFWPFAYMTCAEHMMRDYWVHLAQLGGAATGLDLVQREGGYDAHLFGDMNKAIYGLVLAPCAAFWNPAAIDAIPELLQDLEPPAQGLPGGQPGID